MLEFKLGCYIPHASEDPELLWNYFDSRGKLQGISFKILSPQSHNVGCSRRFPSVDHFLYLSRGHS